MSVTTVSERVELGLMMDHSGWARSVRWSCGRPGVAPRFDRDEHRWAVALEPIPSRLWWLVGAGIVPVEHTFKVTAV